MASFYFGIELAWKDYLKSHAYMQDGQHTIRKSREQTAYPVSDQIKEIIASHEALFRDFPQAFDPAKNTLTEGFGIIGQPIEILLYGVETLGAAFDYGMSLLILQSTIMSEAFDAVVAGLDALHQSVERTNQAQGREAFNTGRDRLAKGLLDKALEAFLQAVQQNELDFLTQYVLGVLYLYGSNADITVVDVEKAEKHFRDAARYAKVDLNELPEAARFCGEAYFQASVACYVQANEKRRMGDIPEAKRLIREAGDLAKQGNEVDPQWTEIAYQQARTCALLGEKEAAIQHLTRAVQADRNYCLKADSMRDFSGMRPDLKEFFETVRQQARDDAHQQLKEMQGLLEDYIFVTERARQSKEHIEQLVKQAAVYEQCGTYFDYLDIQEISKQVHHIFDAVLPDNLVGTLKGHTNSVRSLSFSRDEKYLISGSSDRSVRLWEIPSGKILAVMEGHAGNIFSVSFSPDGRYIVSRSADRTIRLWEMPSGEEIAILQGHTSSVHSSSFSPDGQYMASGSSDNTVGLWQPWEHSLGKQLVALRGHKSSVHSVAFSRDGKYLASGSSDDTIRLWEMPSGRNLAVLEGHRGSVYSVSFSPDSQYLASGSDDTMVRVWNVASRQPILTLQGHEKTVWAVSFSPDGQYLASRSMDNTVRLWEIPSGREHHTIQPPKGTVYSVSFSPDGQYLAMGSWDDTVRLWEIASGTQTASFEGRAVSFSSKGRYLATGSRDGTIRLWGAPILSKQEFWDRQRRKQKMTGSETEIAEADREQPGVCLQCGAKLGFLDKLRGYTLCKKCR